MTSGDPLWSGDFIVTIPAVKSSSKKHFLKHVNVDIILIPRNTEATKEISEQPEILMKPCMFIVGSLRLHAKK